MASGATGLRVAAWQIRWPGLRLAPWRVSWLWVGPLAARMMRVVDARRELVG